MEGRAIRVIGRVQGVGFRAFVVRTASALEILGETWNSRDGSVEVRAAHASHHTLEEFIARLKLGPGRVDGVHAVIWEPPEALEGFTVTATR